MQRPERAFVLISIIFPVMKGLTTIACLLSLLLYCQAGFSQVNHFALANHYNIELGSKSFVRIMGRTNVNTFECSYCSDLAFKVISIGINDNSQNSICLDDAILQLRTSCFDCGLKEMTKDFRELLEEEEHPYMTMEIRCLMADLTQSEVKFTIAGISNFYTIPFEIKEEGGMIRCIGKKAINIRDFGIEPPSKFLGLVKVHEIIEVEFNIFLKINASASVQIQSDVAGN